MHKRSYLPGGGPWMVLQHCPASLHCTLKSARKQNGRCICPRTLALVDIQRTLMRVYNRTVLRPPGRTTATPRWLQAGPWKILDECEAPGHNVITRARGLNGSPKCICPRALVLKAAYDKSRRDAEREAYQQPIEKLPQAVARNIHHYDAPEWTKAACRAPEFRGIVDAGFEVAMKKSAMEGRARAKELCHYRCPMQEICAGWVLQEEDPPGSWGGVWGGMDPWERVKISKSRA